MQTRTRILLIRSIIGLVLGVNIQCAILFLLHPGNFYHGFELPNFPGMEVVRGFGILFLMWNVPYGFALINPVRFHFSTVEAVIMQAIGFFGETAIFLSSPPGHLTFRSTIGRFIAFDGFGLIMLVAALLLSNQIRMSHIDSL